LAYTDYLQEASLRQLVKEIVSLKKWRRYLECFKTQLERALKPNDALESAQRIEVKQRDDDVHKILIQDKLIEERETCLGKHLQSAQLGCSGQQKSGIYAETEEVSYLRSEIVILPAECQAVLASCSEEAGC
jgi:hypothetical protein